MGKILEAIRKFFVQASVVHLREDPAPSPSALVDLIDRFLDGTHRYPMEWDDFISWESDNPHVEMIRQRLGQYEPLLFSGNAEGMKAYCAHLVEERNRIAGGLGLSQREPG